MKNHILAVFSRSIPYLKELRAIAGSVTASILMQQLDFRFNQKPHGFYKFLEPCSHNAYSEGDSWVEELGFSKEEFRTAWAKIGVSYKSRSQYLKSPDKFQGRFYCSYFDRITGLTHYFRNHEAVDRALNSLTTGGEILPKPGNRESQLPGNRESQFTEVVIPDFDLYTEMTYRDDLIRDQDLNTYKVQTRKKRKSDNASLDGTPSVSFSISNSEKNSSCQKVEEVLELPNPQPPSSAAPPSPKKLSQKPRRSPVLTASPGEVIQLPSRGRFMLPGRLALRSTQIELSYLHLSFEFWRDSPDSVFVRDPHEGDDWVEEDEMFSELMPMGLLVTLLQTDQFGPVGVDEVNEAIARWFEFWLARLEEIGSVPKGQRVSVFPEVARLLEIEITGDNEHDCAC